MSFANFYNGRRGRFFVYAPLIIWIAIILILGSGPGASAQTSRFIRPLIEFFFPSASPDTFLLIHAFIRKAAHFIEYAVLAFLAARVFVIGQKHWILLSFAVVAVVAATDEINQSFYSSRSGSGWDVLLDAAGGAFALLCIAVFRRRKRRS